MQIIIFSTRNKKQGFTLIEAIVSVAIFSIISTAIISSFVSITSMQRRIIGMQDIQNDARLLVESFSKEARMAVIDGSGTCAGAVGNVFFVSPSFSTVKFKNFKHECVEYNLLLDTIVRIVRDEEGALISSDNIVGNNVKASYLNFYARDNRPGGEQPFVTLKAILIKPNTNDEYRTMRIQTSLSARAYE